MNPKLVCEVRGMVAPDDGERFSEMPLGPDTPLVLSLLDPIKTHLKADVVRGEQIHQRGREKDPVGREDEPHAPTPRAVTGVLDAPFKKRGLKKRLAAAEFNERAIRLILEKKVQGGLRHLPGHGIWTRPRPLKTIGAG